MITHAFSFLETLKTMFQASATVVSLGASVKIAGYEPSAGTFTRPFIILDVKKGYRRERVSYGAGAGTFRANQIKVMVLFEFAFTGEDSAALDYIRAQVQAIMAEVEQIDATETLEIFRIKNWSTIREAVAGRGEAAPTGAKFGQVEIELSI
jgi:hypothetical protein